MAKQWTVKVTRRNPDARSLVAKAVADEKHAQAIARNADRVAAYRAAFEAGKAGKSFADARYEYEKLTSSMSAKVNEAFQSGHWAGSHGEECEF